MDFPLEIVYRDVPHTDSTDALIRQKVAKLERMFDHLIGCRVAVETYARRGGGDAYRVRVEMSVPNGDLVASVEPSEGGQREDLGVAIRAAFDKATRRLQDYKQKVAGHVKAPVHPPHAIVTQVFHEQGYGFIKTPDGRDLYFHENALVDGDFEVLEPGDEVRFAEREDGLEGPHASTLHRVGKSGHELNMP